MAFWNFVSDFWNRLFALWGRAKSVGCLGCIWHDAKVQGEPYDKRNAPWSWVLGGDISP